MNERRLLILAAIGASVVAYVVYALLSRSVTAPPDSKPDVAVPAADRSRDDSAAPPRTRVPPKRAVVPGKRPAAKPSGGPPPALPIPDISLEDAREDYGDLMAELERELQRNKDTGKALANEHWVEYYRRGHEVMTPLRRYLSLGSEDGKTEVAGMDEDLRNIMGKLQIDPAKLEEDPPAE